PLACSPDDDLNTTPLRDPLEVLAEDTAEILSFLSTHFYNYEEFQNPPAGFNFMVQFDTIAGVNSDKTPLINQVTLKNFDWFGIDYPIYVLMIDQGAGSQVAFADQTTVTYEGRLLDRRMFDSFVTPGNFDLTTTIPGFTAALQEFKTADGFTIGGDNSLNYQNFGVGAFFLPSGIAFFANPPTNSIVPTYAPLIYSINVLETVKLDHDNDGLLSEYEDLNGDGILNNDDTDGDFVPNYLDSDDDGDNIPTSSENADPNGDGNPDDALISTPNGIPDYLNPEFPFFQN
ncbi:MAG: peptidylprolyl isomerase, partial [Flavobacteriaceae bacterium]|nr:peptidylprolyl isomerase [Flavobacteriaceae bacterium]